MSKNQEQQINELNSIVKATLGRSEVHGIGVIALRDIRKGEKIYADKLPEIYTIRYAQLKQLFPEVRKVILDRWPSVINGSRFIYPDARLVSFMNHSASPNYDPYKDEATEFIAKESEIFENYLLMPNHEKIWPNLKSWQNQETVLCAKKSLLKRSTNAVRVVLSSIKNSVIS